MLDYICEKLERAGITPYHIEKVYQYFTRDEFRIFCEEYPFKYK